MKSRKYLLAYSLLALILACGLASCTKKERVDPNRKVFHYPLGDDVRSLDPAIAYDSVSLAVMPLCVESLFQYSYTITPLELEPLLAESMPLVAKDKKTFTIKLKKGVFFQDDPAFAEGKGRELKADDFIYAWKRLLSPEIQSPGTWIFEDKVIGYSELKKEILAAGGDKAKAEELLNKSIEGMKALDEYTIQIKLNRPYPQLLHVLAMGFAAPIAKEVIAKYGQLGLHERMVGTGPFLLKKFLKSSQIVLVKNPHYREEKYPSSGDEDAQKNGLLAAAGKALPFLDEISFDIYKEQQPQWLQFQAAKLDVSGIPKDNFSSAISADALTPELVKKGIQLSKGNESVTWFLEFNMKDKVVGGSNANLRKAISMAVDRNEFVHLFANDRGIKATSLLPVTIAGFTTRDKLENDFNLEEARKLLAKAGYPEGKGLPVIRYDLRGASTSSRQQGDYIANSLKKIGINIQVESNTFPAFLDKAKNGNLQFFMGGWNADYPDAENFMQLLYSKNISPGPNDANFVNPQYDKLYEKIASMAPSKERTALIKNAEQIIFDSGVWSMLYYPLRYSLYHAWVKNYRPNAQIQNELKYIDLDLAQKKETLRNF